MTEDDITALVKWLQRRRGKAEVRLSNLRYRDAHESFQGIRLRAEIETYTQLIKDLLLGEYPDGQ